MTNGSKRTVSTWRQDVLGALVILGVATTFGLVVNLFHPRGVSVRRSGFPEERSPSDSVVQGGLRAVTADTLKAWLLAGKCLVLDAREPQIYAEAHIPGARNLPVDFLEDSAATVQQLPRRRWLVCYCDGPPCDLGERLANELKHWGFERVAVYLGGLADWRRRGEPVTASGGQR